MKHSIFSFFLIIFLAEVGYSQISELPTNPEPGKCFVRCIDENNSLGDWYAIDCKYSKFDTIQIKNLQEKLITEGFDVVKTGYWDKTTLYTVNNKYQLKRKMRREKKMEKKNKS